MYRSSPLRSTLNTGYITGLDMCKVCTEAVHCAALWTCVHMQKNVIIPTPPHPTPPYPMWCVRGWLWVEKMMQNCACVYLWLQSVCAGDSGKWLCAHVTPVCVRRWPWVEKMMQNCACVYLWLQSVCAGDPLTLPPATEHGMDFDGSLKCLLVKWLVENPCQKCRNCRWCVVRLSSRSWNSALKARPNRKHLQKEQFGDQDSWCFTLPSFQFFFQQKYPNDHRQPRHPNSCHLSQLRSEYCASTVCIQLLGSHAGHYSGSSVGHGWVKVSIIAMKGYDSYSNIGAKYIV